MTTAPTSMRANVLVAPRTLELEERPVPIPGPHDVLIKVTAVGVCGSDVHFYQEGRLGDWVVSDPLVLGHEAGGVIVGVGESVAPDRIGSRVAIEPQHPNPWSAESLRGAYNLDPEMQFYAVPGVDGAFQEYVTIGSHFAFDVPDEISDDAAALMEPLSVGIATIRKAQLGLGSTVYIAGAGPIGLITAQVARAYGASEVVVGDIATQRRDAALRFGATAAIDPATTDLSSVAVDVFIDASGAPAAVNAGIKAVRPGGRVVLVGMGPENMTLPVSTIMNRELELTGVFRYVNTWPIAIRAVRDGVIDLDGLVTGHFPLADVADALESTHDPRTLKSVVTPTA